MISNYATFLILLICRGVNIGVIVRMKYCREYI